MTLTPQNDDELIKRALNGDAVDMPNPTPSQQALLNRIEHLRVAAGSARASVIARPSFDSRVTPLVFGFRGGSESFMAAWEWDGGEIEVEATLIEINNQRGADPGRSWRLQGQVTLQGGSPQGAAIFVPANRQVEPKKAIVDGDGSFDTILGSGSYDIAAQTHDHVYVVRGLTLA